jgi:hypothetical protein
MYIAPNSLLKLLNNVPLDNKYKHTLYFSNKSDQQDYFALQHKYSLIDYTYLREQKKIRVGIKADLLFDCNYLMYQNTSFGSKWFYAFITKVEYINNECTEISFEIDVMQTWLVGDDYNIKPSFVEREHVVNDEIGANRVDEKLEIGSYIIKNKTGTLDVDGVTNMIDMAYIVGISDLSPLSSETDKTIGRMYGNLYSGLTYWYFHKSKWTDLKAFLQTYIDAKKTDAIVFISSIPAFLVGTSSGAIQESETLPSLTVGLDKPYDNIDGYVPKNKKLFTYPYNLLYVTNNQGGYSEFRYEEFTSVTGQPDIRFGIIGNIAPSPMLQCCPVSYKVGSAGYDGMNTEYAIPMQGYPLCSWTDDVFKAWLVNNGINTAVNTMAGIGAILGGASTANAGIIAGGAMAVFNQMSQLYRASLQPDQAKGNTNGGTLNIATERQEFYFQKMQIRAEFAKKIDGFFTMYGYKVNELKVPNINGRPHWNYVKTIDITLVGSVPSEDMEKIQGIYNNGITFWKNASEVGNYILDNSML